LFSIKTRIGSATSAALKGFSSDSPKNSDEGPLDLTDRDRERGILRQSTGRLEPTRC